MSKLESKSESESESALLSQEALQRQNNLVLYHANCYDGFTAAWAAWRYLGEENTKYIAVNYGEKIPDISVDNLFILDFSYPEGTLHELVKTCRRVFILDHHLSAQRDLANFPNSDDLNVESEKYSAPGVYVKFDMEKSGAKLAWEFFATPEKFLPACPLVDYVEDRDLWRFKLPNSQKVNAFIRTTPFTFPAFLWLSGMMEKRESLERIVEHGETILHLELQQIRLICKNVFFMHIENWIVPCVNTSIHFSECAAWLLVKYPDYPFAVYYFDKTREVRQWGLRSRTEEDFDVSAIAKRFGGGGHRNAAGFTTQIVVEEG